jgi:hypothetical protein
MKPEVSKFDLVQDIDGAVWEARHIRTTKYGFDLIIGAHWPRRGSYRMGPARLLATQPLVDFWEANRLNHDGMVFDLPAGRTTLKRLRRRLGFNYFGALSEFWQERIEDLKTLSAREFAKRHDVNLEVVFDTRRKLLGIRARPLDWWKKPLPLQVLRSKIPLREVGEKLGISISHAKRLRDRLPEVITDAPDRTTAPTLQISAGSPSLPSLDQRI